MTSMNLAFGLFAAATVFAASGATEGTNPIPADPLDAVRTAIQRGEKKITVKPGRYFVDPKDSDGKCYLELKGLSDMVIDFGGA